MGLKNTKIKNIFSHECCETRLKENEEKKRLTNYNFDIDDYDAEPQNDVYFNTDTCDMDLDEFISENKSEKKNIKFKFIEFTSDSFRS